MNGSGYSYFHELVKMSCKKRATAKKNTFLLFGNAPIVSIANNDGDGIVTADEAESRVIEEVRRMGNEVLTGWAESRVEKAGETLPSEEKTVRSGKKKNLLAQHVR
ncbi:hypothetical protein GKODMF_08655 [Candidatus Electrothrix gigas]